MELSTLGPLGGLWGTSYDNGMEEFNETGTGAGAHLPGNGTCTVNCNRQGLQISEHLKYVTLVFYMSTFVFGILGNSLVIYILTRFSEVRVKSVANYYILNLALADEIFILTLPVFCYATITNDWIFGEPLCKISYVLREINKFGSIFTLAALSLDRYVASFHNLGHLRTIRVGKCVCLCIWVASLAMCTPYFMYSSTVERGAGKSCVINWPTKNTLYHKRIWTYSQMTLGLLVPFSLISISYICLVRRLQAIMRPRKSDRIRKPNRKMTRTVLVVFIIFVICQVPYYVIDVINLKKHELVVAYMKRGEKYSPGPIELSAFVYCNAAAQILVFVSSCCNPVLYGILNENYSKSSLFIHSLTL